MDREGKLPADERVTRLKIEDIPDINGRKHVAIPRHRTSASAGMTGTIGAHGLWFECFGGIETLVSIPGLIKHREPMFRKVAH